MSTVSSPTPTLSARASQARECDICHELQPDVGQLIDHLASRHPETKSNPSRPYFCGRYKCSRIKTHRDFERHLTRTAVHSQVAWRCRCGYRSSRKENFRNHFTRRTCPTTDPYHYVCACGNFKVDSRENNAFDEFSAHFAPCEKRHKGHPKRTYPFTTGEIETKCVSLDINLDSNTDPHFFTTPEGWN
ncbi:hypothetical protein F4678DRAFT_269589 [Xylaria arbuscula]|nr:hypothetical protein F4678DRAFT_269589 [Xylaria arbuscula]